MSTRIPGGERRWGDRGIDPPKSNPALRKTILLLPRLLLIHPIVITPRRHPTYAITPEEEALASQFMKLVTFGSPCPEYADGEMGRWITHEADYLEIQGGIRRWRISQ